MKVAVISDIHGNSWALNTVLEDIKNRNVDMIVNLGDSFYGPLDPKGTFDILKNSEILNIAGNTDRFLVENFNKKTDHITYEFVKSELNSVKIEWINSFPSEKILDCGIYLCHGTPKEIDTYLLEEFIDGHVIVKTPDKIDELLAGVKQDVVLCGHSHLPRIVKTKNKTIINPGSVGLPAYDDKLPMQHNIENYHPNARYCILYKNDNNVMVEQISLIYNCEEAARKSEENNREDWARWIRTGRSIE